MYFGNFLGDFFAKSSGHPAWMFFFLKDHSMEDDSDISIED
jgi:hypothetical protein